MKATFDLPEDLVRAVKQRALNEHKKLKDLVPELLRRGLDVVPESPAIRVRVELPLIHGGHPAPPGEELTPERIHDILLEQEIEWYS